MASFEDSDDDLQEESDDYSYESGEDDNASDSEAETSPPQQPYPVSLSEEEVASEARRRATAVQRALGCSAFAARVALRLGRWQHAAAVRDAAAPDAAAAGDEDSCAVCYGDGLALVANERCGHGFCGDCWRGFLAVAPGLDAGCPSAGCGRLPSDAVVARVFGENSPEAARRAALWANSLVDDGADARWCPRGCGRAVLFDASGDGARCAEARCDCDDSNRFCGRCGLDAHAPATCADAVTWVRKREEDATVAADAAVAAKVKRCPNPACGCAVEKNGGCNYMRCASCREFWCWHCGAWGGGPSRRDPPHHLFFCNDPATSFATLEDDGRYAFYSERSAAHGASRAFATTQLEKSHKLAKKIAAGSADPDASFLPNAVALVVRCRATLEWSYCFAYYERDDDKRRLFAFAQKQLETFTEELSGLTEQKAADVADARRRIVFLAAALTKYRANIADWGA